LFILAGADFGPSTSGQVKDTDTIFIVSGDSSATGGSVQLGGVSINTSTTAVDKNGGYITVGAFGSPTNPGVISLGAINASASKGTGGRLLLIGEGGVQVNGAINTSGSVNGGDVIIAGTAPQSVDGRTIAV